MATASQTDLPRSSGDDADRGVQGNERLTAWAGAALLIGFAVEGYTILNVHWYMAEHILIGMALFLPLGVKLASTIYRFARYYTNDPAYRRKGPPQLALRVLAPVLIVNTLVVLLTGVALMITDSYHRLMEDLHKLTFFSWLALFAVHVLAYVWRLPRLMLADLRGRETSRGDAFRRIAVVTASGLLGLGLAALLPWVRG